MGGSKKQELPNAPTWQADPYLAKNQEALYGASSRLANLDFSGGWNPLLQKTTAMFDPQMSDEFTKVIMGQMNPVMRDKTRDLTNLLANTGSLGASTASNAYTQMYGDFMNQAMQETGKFNLATAQQALENRIRLEGMGLEGLQGGGSMAISNQNAMNQFNLQNYENQVARQLYSEQNKGGGLLGALQGGLGGAMTGFAMTGGNPLGALAGGLGGGISSYFSPVGAPMGANQWGQSGMYGAGMMASNSPFRSNTGLATPVRPTYDSSGTYDVSDIMNKYFASPSGIKF